MSKDALTRRDILRAGSAAAAAGAVAGMPGGCASGKRPAGDGGSGGARARAEHPCVHPAGTPLSQSLARDGRKIEAKLAKLAQVVLPGGSHFPGAAAAGVAVYLARVAGKARTATKWSDFLDALPDDFADQDAAKAEEAVAALLPPRLDTPAAGTPRQQGLVKSFLALRDEMFTGYFAHPRHRDGKGREVWPAIYFRPQLRPHDDPGTAQKPGTPGNERPPAPGERVTAGEHEHHDDKAHRAEDPTKLYQPARPE